MQVSARFVVVMWLATILTNASVGAAELGSCGAQGSSQTNALPVLKGKIHTLGKDPWPTIDPFLFCAYHLDDFPAALPGTLGPAPRELRGRQIGSDFSRRDGWSMYHGDQVPGFPAHPHRGFETVTIVPKGLVDHFDSMGATGRYGNGDVQWLTTGDGVQHSEMFPLVNDTAGNPLELFQLWLNLPRKSKKAKPYFAMLWSEDMPHFEDITRFPGATVKVVAGAFRTTKPLPPPPDSWAADEGNDVAIWLLYLRGKGSFIDVPAAKAALSRRMLYVVRTSQGVQVSVAAQSSTEGCAPMDTLNFHSAWRGAEVESQNELRVTLHRGDEESEAVLLVLQGVPINEPVAQHGPFVLNTQAELQQTFEDYRRTQFGGWPWPSDSHCHPKEQHRFAKRSKSAIPEAPPS